MGSIWWYSTRAAGLVAWGLLSASVIAGLLLSGKVTGGRVRPNWLTDLHRGLSGLAVAFVGVHVVTVVADSYVHFGAADVLVPMASGWKPLAVAWGIVSMYLLVAVEATSLLRRHLTKKQWRAVHLLSFPLFLSATAHGVSAGTELGTLGGTIAALLVTATVAGLTTYRILDARERAAHAGRIPVDVVRMAP
ncbi:MAG: ferric reductase-like transmembrane domain-containing protein [Acidimicrobiales bacterium]